MQSGYRKAAQPRVKSGKQGLYRDMLPRKARSIEEPLLYHRCPLSYFSQPCYRLRLAFQWLGKGATEIYSELPTPHSLSLSMYRLRHLSFVNAAAHNQIIDFFNVAAFRFDNLDNRIEPLVIDPALALPLAASMKLLMMNLPLWPSMSSRFLPTIFGLLPRATLIPFRSYANQYRSRSWNYALGRHSRTRQMPSPCRYSLSTPVTACHGVRNDKFI